jgi:hypothetical protein
LAYFILQHIISLSFFDISQEKVLSHSAFCHN